MRHIPPAILHGLAQHFNGGIRLAGEGSETGDVVKQLGARGVFLLQCEQLHASGTQFGEFFGDGFGIAFFHERKAASLLRFGLLFLPRNPLLLAARAEFLELPRGH